MKNFYTLDEQAIVNIVNSSTKYVLSLASKDASIELISSDLEDFLMNAFTRWGYRCAHQRSKGDKTAGLTDSGRDFLQSLHSDHRYYQVFMDGWENLFDDFPTKTSRLDSTE